MLLRMAISLADAIWTEKNYSKSEKIDFQEAEKFRWKEGRALSRTDLFQFENVFVEVVLDALVCKVDAELLEMLKNSFFASSLIKIS